jgi:hypothetical protein
VKPRNLAAHISEEKQMKIIKQCIPALVPVEENFHHFVISSKKSRINIDFD